MMMMGSQPAMRLNDFLNENNVVEIEPKKVIRLSEFLSDEKADLESHIASKAPYLFAQRGVSTQGKSLAEVFKSEKEYTKSPEYLAGQKEIGEKFQSFAQGVLPLGPEEWKLSAEKHPIANAVGQVTGFIGAGELTGGIAPLVTYSKQLAALPTFAKFAAGHMAQTGLTFGIKELADDMAELSSGDKKEFGQVVTDVLTQTGSGAVLGVAGAIANPIARIPAQAAYGFVSSKIQGSDNVEAGINAGIFGVFGLFNTRNLADGYKKAAASAARQALADRLVAKGVKEGKADLIAKRYMSYAVARNGGYAKATVKDFDQFSKAMRKGWKIIAEPELKPASVVKQAGSEVKPEAGVKPVQSRIGKAAQVTELPYGDVAIQLGALPEAEIKPLSEPYEVPETTREQAIAALDKLDTIKNPTAEDYQKAIDVVESVPGFEQQISEIPVEQIQIALPTPERIRPDISGITSLQREIDAMDNLIERVEASKSQLDSLNQIRDFVKRRITFYKDKYLAEELKDIPRIYIKKEGGLSPDQIMDELRGQFGLEFNSEVELSSYLQDLEKSRNKLLEKIEEDSPGYLKKKETTFLSEKIKVAELGVKEGIKQEKVKTKEVEKELITVQKEVEKEKIKIKKDISKMVNLFQKDIEQGIGRTKKEIKEMQKDLVDVIKELNISDKTKQKLLTGIYKVQSVDALTKELKRIDETLYFGRDWTIEQREEIETFAREKGLIYTDFKGKDHDSLGRFIEAYPEASFEQIKKYIRDLKGSKRNPPVIPTTKAITISEWNQPFNDLTDFQSGPLSMLDPIRAAELVDGESFGPVRTVIVEQARNREKDWKSEFKNALDGLTKVSQGMKSKSKESELVFKFIEKTLTPEEEKKITPVIKDTADYLRKLYKELLKRINEVRIEAGKDPIPERENYITHLQELSLLDEFFQGMSNISNEAIKNIPAFIKSNSLSFRFAFERLGGDFKLDAIEAFKVYASKAYPVIHNTNVIRISRALTNRLPHNAYRYFNQYIDEVLALRPARADQLFPKIVLKGLTAYRTMMGKGAILGNLASILNQPFTLPNITSASGVKFTASAMLKTFDPAYRSFCEANSKTLQNRIFEIDFDPNVLKNADKALAFIMNLADREMVRISFGAAFEKAISENKSIDDAIRLADDISFKTQSGFNLTELPPAFRSKFASTFLQFQNTVNGGFNFIRFDLGKNYEGERKKWAVFKAGLTLLGTFIALNKLYDLLGLPTPVDSVDDLIPLVTLGKYGPPATYAGPMAMITLMVSDDPYDKSKAWNRLKNSAFLFMSGGNQLRKTWAGIEANIAGGKIDKKGKVLFPITTLPEQARSVAFGPYATRSGKKYIKEQKKKKSRSKKSVNQGDIEKLYREQFGDRK